MDSRIACGRFRAVLEDVTDPGDVCFYIGDLEAPILHAQSVDPVLDQHCFRGCARRNPKRILRDEDCGFGPGACRNRGDRVIAGQPIGDVAFATTQRANIIVNWIPIMRTANRATKTFSLDLEVLGELKRTKGGVSESERVNRLLRLALDQEKRFALDQEAADFFGETPSGRAERRAFQKAAKRVLARE
jgi:hypothetical protein